MDLMHSVAPEIESKEKVTTVSDCYSFGCMIYEIMFEKKCFEKEGYAVSI